MNVVSNTINVNIDCIILENEKRVAINKTPYVKISDTGDVITEIDLKI